MVTFDDMKVRDSSNQTLQMPGEVTKGPEAPPAGVKISSSTMEKVGSGVGLRCPGVSSRKEICCLQHASGLQRGSRETGAHFLGPHVLSSLPS